MWEINHIFVNEWEINHIFVKEWEIDHIYVNVWEINRIFVNEWEINQSLGSYYITELKWKHYTFIIQISNTILNQCIPLCL